MSDAPIITMAETLENLNASPVPILPDQEATLREERAVMERDEQVDQIWKLKTRGATIRQIAETLGVSSSTVDRQLREAKIRHLHGIESDTAAENLAGQIQHLEEYERMCLYEAGMLQQDKEASLTKEGQLALAAKSKFIKLAMDARGDIIDLYLQTGVLPKEAQRMYHTMEEEGKIKDKTVDALVKPKSREEMIENLLKALGSTHRI